MDAQAQKIPASVVILTLNEASRIERCLESVRCFAHVLIVDSLSTDGTLDRARALWQSWGEDENALTLVSRAWPGFTAARNESLSWTREAWTLWLDADEWISEDFAEWCRKLPRSPGVDVPPLYQVARQSFFLGTKIRHGGWYPDFKRRMVRSEKAVWRSGPHGSDVHEDLDVRAEGDFSIALTAAGEIYHEPFRDEVEQKATNELYSGLLAEGLATRWQFEKRDRPPSELYVRSKVAVKFLENYLFKLGILDGTAGLKIAQGSAWSMGRRLTKAREIFLRKKKA
ncbi:MAG: glycosyltransferase family 2 protein [Bdellovibrionota bacterium]